MSATATLPTPAASSRLMTADEFWDFVNRTENGNKSYELVRGKVIEIPPPSTVHGIVASRIARKLWDYAEQIGRGFVTSNDSGVILGHDPDTVRGPDAAFFTESVKYEDVKDQWAQLPPFLAVEVRSPSDSRRQVLAKIDDYLLAGVKLVWLVDLDEQFVTVYRTNQKHETFDADQALACVELPGFSCPVSHFFQLPGNVAKS